MALLSGVAHAYRLMRSSPTSACFIQSSARTSGSTLLLSKKLSRRFLGMLLRSFCCASNKGFCSRAILFAPGLFSVCLGLFCLDAGGPSCPSTFLFGGCGDRLLREVSSPSPGDKGGLEVLSPSSPPCDSLLFFLFRFLFLDFPMIDSFLRPLCADQ